MPWVEKPETRRVYVIDPNAPPEWECSACGFHNRPRPVPNSLGTLSADNQLFDPAWRAGHCEQCGAERKE
jgi:hypothetical protein